MSVSLTARLGSSSRPGRNFLAASSKGEFAQPDRCRYAGMLFMNNEGTENGGLIFGGHQSSDGKPHSFGHLSFDEYQEGQSHSTLNSRRTLMRLRIRLCSFLSFSQRS